VAWTADFRFLTYPIQPILSVHGFVLNLFRLNQAQTKSGSSPDAVVTFFCDLASGYGRLIEQRPYGTTSAIAVQIDNTWTTQEAKNGNVYSFGVCVRSAENPLA
jgi:hypothetical protein